MREEGKAKGDFWPSRRRVLEAVFGERNLKVASDEGCEVIVVVRSKDGQTSLSANYDDMAHLGGVLSNEVGGVFSLLRKRRSGVRSEDMVGQVSGEVH